MPQLNKDEIQNDTERLSNSVVTSLLPKPLCINHSVSSIRYSFNLKFQHKKSARAL